MLLQMKSLIKMNLKKVSKKEQIVTKGIEVGHIFYFETNIPKQ